MKVFISWSGTLSHKVALILRDWLPSVIQSIQPYVSSEDIDKGARWSSDISKELEDSTYGILCITEENLNAPWINFEAGALSKSVDKSRVSPFLFGVKRSEVQGPLLQFQSTTFEKEDVCKLLKSLNNSIKDGALDDGRLQTIFDVWWPSLEKLLKELEAASLEKGKPLKSDKPDEHDILEEILELSRQHQRLLRDPSQLLPPEYVQSVLRGVERLPEGHPAFRDVEAAFHEFKSVLVLFSDKEAIPRDVLLPLFNKLEGPIEYILRRYWGPRRTRRMGLLNNPSAD